MDHSVIEYFNNRVSAIRFLELFEEIAKAITEEYIQQIADSVEENGYTPPFNEMLMRVSSLTRELRLRANWVKEDYRVDKGRKSVRLTTGCKRIIKNCVSEYQNKMKMIISVKREKTPIAEDFISSTSF